MKKKGLKKMTMFFLTFAVIIIGIFSVLMIKSGIFSTSRYLDPWKTTYSQQFKDIRVRLAAHGLLAANGHNMQPWIVRLDQEDANVFYLYADSSRLVAQVDPLARQTMVTQGAFLEYVKDAGDQLGYHTDIVLFPNGNYDEASLKESMDTKPVAKISLTKVEPINNELYPYIFLPDTNRGAYETTPLTKAQVNKLQGISDVKDVSLEIFQDQENLDRLGQYAMEGARIESAVHRINEESANIFRANEYEKNKYRYGFSLEGERITGLKKHVMQGMITMFPSINNEKASADLFVKSTQVAVEHTPTYAMIITKDNSRSNQVKAGMLYSRLILEAHNMGFVMQPPSQVLEEYPEMKEPYTKIHKKYAPNGKVIQMLVRMGKPTEEAQQTMRRDVMDLIKN
ncbi:hypothetical protein AB1283_06545 [Bacillus sp. S13(2024)]|uniref:Acg family FMN-binding oxidoreductase n=1 Tax=unclassified Bacillus (in: firmicutes) TaxID=185979 RepID=UPI003D22288E